MFQAQAEPSSSDFLRLYTTLEMKWGDIKSANNLEIEAKLLNNNVFYKLPT